MTPHQILGVDASASEVEIKAAFRAKAKKCHPDLRPDKEAATREFRELNTAYERALKGAKYTRSDSFPEFEVVFEYDFNPLQPGYSPGEIDAILKILERYIRERRTGRAK
jgi:molecular chaperone DnaJ